MAKSTIFIDLIESCFESYMSKLLPYLKEGIELKNARVCDGGK